MHRSVNVERVKLIFIGISKRGHSKNETALDDRTCRLCFCTRTDFVSISYARSNALYAGRRRGGSHSGQRRPRPRTWAWAWLGPSRRSGPSLWLVAGSPSWLAESSPLVVPSIDKPAIGTAKPTDALSIGRLATECAR